MVKRRHIGVAHVLWPSTDTRKKSTIARIEFTVSQSHLDTITCSFTFTKESREWGRVFAERYWKPRSWALELELRFLFAAGKSITFDLWGMVSGTCGRIRWRVPRSADSCWPPRIYARRRDHRRIRGPSPECCRGNRSHPRCRLRLDGWRPVIRLASRWWRLRPIFSGASTESKRKTKFISRNKAEYLREGSQKDLFSN